MSCFVGQLVPARQLALARSAGRGQRRVCLHMSAMKDNKMLHVVYRVGDLDATKAMYTKCLGMKVLRERDIPEGKYANCFLGFGPEQKGEHFSVELTFNYGVDKYNIGNGFANLTLAVPDVKAAAEQVKANGGKLTSEPAPLTTGSGLSAEAEDPDGYKFQLVERKQRDPVVGVNYRTGNLDKSIDFYQNALGMTLIRKLSVPAENSEVAFLGYGPEDDSTVVQLTYTKGVTSYEKGDGYGQIAVSTPDVYAAAEQITKAGYEVTRAPGPVPGIGTKITAVQDPDGYKTVLVDAEDFEKEFE